MYFEPLANLSTINLDIFMKGREIYFESLVPSKFDGQTKSQVEHDFQLIARQ